MRETDTAISQRVTKPKVFNEAIHFRAKSGTKERLDALRGEMRQGDFVRLLLEDAIERRERGSVATLSASDRDLRKRE